MPEVTAPEAAAIIGKSIHTVHRRIDEGTLLARKEGTGERKRVYIEIDELRRFAGEYGYRFDEVIAAKYAG